MIQDFGDKIVFYVFPRFFGKRVEVLRPLKILERETRFELAPLTLATYILPVIYAPKNLTKSFLL